MKIQTLFETTLLQRAEEGIARLEPEVDEALQAGEIVNPKYKELNTRIGRDLEHIARDVVGTHFQGAGNKWSDIDPALEELYYGMPTSVNAMASFGKKLAKVKAKDTAPYKSALEFYNKYKGIAEKMAQLKPMVVSAVKKREDTKAAVAKERDRSFDDSTTLVGVLKEHMGEYIDRAGNMAAEQYDKWMKYLGDNNWDLDTVAPAPHDKMTRENYQKMKRRRDMIEAMTDRDGGQYNLRKASPEKRSHRIKQSRKAAEDSYMAWIHKLIGLIGKPVESADMQGNPWTGSILRVKTIDGEEHAYKTQMKLNFSKYDLPFNQFPTLRIK
jgi:bifunctional DNA-binding transcriptional regulator/antitoxin component of YhaV-PrlF toxin-antitoxin module